MTTVRRAVVTTVRRAVMTTVVRRARVHLVGRRARGLLRLTRLGLGVVVVMVVVDVMPRDLQVDTAERFPLRQQFAELRVQLLQAKSRHQ
jgi:hypothetical protein